MNIIPDPLKHTIVSNPLIGNDENTVGIPTLEHWNELLHSNAGALERVIKFYFFLKLILLSVPAINMLMFFLTISTSSQPSPIEEKEKMLPLLSGED